MHWTDRRERYRELLNGNECLHPGSVFDAISARIAEDVGFEVGMFAGSIGSFSVLGAPDLIVLTLTEFAAQAYRINRAGKLPLMVDADHGYGNALNVMRTIQELETAGVAGIMIEDTVLPRAFGEKKPRIDFAGRRNRQNARRVARARRQVADHHRPHQRRRDQRPGGRSGACQSLSKGGVDAMFFAGGMTRELLETLHAELKIPIMLGGGGGDLDKAWLGSMGVRIALQGHQPFSAAVQAVYNTLKALRDGTKPSALTGIASSELMGKVTRSSDYKAWTDEFLN